MIHLEKVPVARKVKCMPLSGGISMAAAIGAVYVLDKVSKHIVTVKMSEGESLPVLEGFFHLTLVHNTGGAFGIMKNNPHVFTGAAAIFTVLAVIYVTLRWTLMAFRDKAAVCLILGGTLGNLSDRLRLGYVIDFFDLRIWPVFNIADSCITIGAAMLIFSVLAFGDKGKNA